MAYASRSLQPAHVVGGSCTLLGAYLVVPKLLPKLLPLLRSRTAASVATTREERRPGARGQKKKAAERVHVDAKFVAQMRKLLPIVIPGPFSREAGLLISLALVLVARTALDIWFSSFNGQIVAAIVSRNRSKFIAKIFVEFGLMMWPLSIVNNSLKLVISALSLSFRARLTKKAHDEYLRGITFYKVSNIDNRLQNADQLLAQDIAKFSDNLSKLYSDTAKPIVDIFLFAYKLGEAIGRQAPLVMISYFFLSGGLLRAMSPPFGKYTAVEQELEGEFRYVHSRIITHAEEIAFYQGAAREKAIANSSFQRILDHVRKVYTLRFANGIFDSIMVKYCATMVAYYLLGRPVFDPRYATKHMGDLSSDTTKLVNDYSRNSSYLVSLSQAVGRVILAGRDLSRFAGYTARISELFDVLEDVNAGRYHRTMVSKDEKDANVNRTVDENDFKGEVRYASGVILFEKVPIVTPNADVLVKEMSITVKAGMNVLITGPNGCGKSSLFRILGDLWPLFGGTVTKPTVDRLFYVPQRPYLALGTLRDQLIYPHSQEQALARGSSDEELRKILDVVHLTYLIEREGGWDAVQDYADVLSGGEKQRIAMGRCFYHKPEFAILDECTSAVSIDVEALMYNHARNIGITLFTVSHRTSLFKHHDYLLRFDGDGGYQFIKLTHSNEENAFSFGHGKSEKTAKFQLAKEP